MTGSEQELRKAHRGLSRRTVEEAGSTWWRKQSDLSKQQGEPEWQEPHRVGKKPLTGFDQINAVIWSFCWVMGWRGKVSGRFQNRHPADEKLAG